MTDQPDLREQIAKALAEHDGFVWTEEAAADAVPNTDWYRSRAAAALDVLPEGWDRFVRTIEQLRDGWRKSDQEHTRNGELLLWLHAEKVWQFGKTEASRRDWAAEAMAHDMAAEFQAVGTLDDPWPEEPGANAPCVCCFTDEQAQKLRDLDVFSLPQCSRHPREGGDPEQLPLFDLTEETS